jgi:brefeldin A-resistance guanine nucleotide exchange factor 1
MRLNTRWSHAAKMGREVSYAEEDSLTQPFRRLNEYLEGIFDLREVDCVMYIMPFHNIIVSEKASGPLTSAALTSLTKFALYGFLSEPYPRVQEGVSLIANCISRCVFEETDWESDELILMKLLELSTLCYRCNASRLLTIASAWEMYNTCISIHNHYRASKILKSEAENALVHLTLSAFGRVVPGGRNTVPAGLVTNDTTHELEALKGRSWESVRDSYNMSSETGVTLLLVKVMAVLSDTADLQKHSAETVQFALALINVALEAGGPSLSALEPLVEVLSNDVCRHLLRASQSEDLAIVSLALRVVFNLFMSIKNHMKVQLEVFLISVHLRLISTQPTGGASTPVPPSSSSSVGGAAQAAIAALAAAKEELALESLLEFCREPSLMNDIYVNYDCDMQCTNLFDSIITTLCRRALPRSLLSETSFGGEKAKAGGPQSPGKGPLAGRAVEAPSPSQLFTYGSSGGLFGLEAPLPPSVKVSAPDTPPRLSIVNRLALDGVLAVLRSVAGQIGGCCAPPAPQSAEKSAAMRPHEDHASDPVHYDNMTFPSEELDQQVDKWCESGSTSPTCEVLSQEEQDAAQVPSSSAAVQPAVLHRLVSGGSVNTDFSGSAGSPRTSRAQGGRSYSVGMNAVDGENEVTTAQQLARVKHAEVRE